MRRALRLFLLPALLGGVALLGTTVASADARTVWLCKPGFRVNPCEPSLKTTMLSPSGDRLGVRNHRHAGRRRIDCFYVYPTVSDQPRLQANLNIDPELRSIALYHAAPFSRDCRVFVPVYRQITVRGVLSPGGLTGRMRARAYADVRQAWRTYLAKYNRGRGVVLVGHSQGTYWLKRLLAREIDPRRRLRRRLVSALLIGPASRPLGNGVVTVRRGRDVGGDFKHISACRSRRQLGCVVAYSAFPGRVPEDALYARTDAPGLEPLCTNPAALVRRSSRLRTLYPSEPFAPSTIAALSSLSRGPLPAVRTPWLEYRGAYRARCRSAEGANALMISTSPGAPRLNSVPAGWGLHLEEFNLALGSLTDLVRVQAHRFARTRSWRRRAPAFLGMTRPAP